jgi:hypothetical protein
VYGRRVNSFVLVLVFHHTDTSLYLLSLALALSIHNKLKNKQPFLGLHRLVIFIPKPFVANALGFQPLRLC